MTRDSRPIRRRGLARLLGAAAAWPPIASAQQAPTPALIGFLHLGAPAAYGSFIAAFHRGLGEEGYVDGRNVVVEHRWAEGVYERLPALAADLAGRRVSVIVAGGGNAPAQAARAAAAPAIPVIFITGGDPVRGGLVSSFTRPGGNTTGVTMLLSSLVQKRLEILRELAPAAASVGALVNPNYPEIAIQLEELHEAAAVTGQRIDVARAGTEVEIDAAIAALAGRGASALIIANDPFFVGRREQIVALAARHALPAIYQGREFALAGGLISYGPSLADAFRQAGVYTARVVKGVKPADLPVLQPAIFELAVNLKTAGALGVTIPRSVLTRADEIIE